MDGMGNIVNVEKWGNQFMWYENSFRRHLLDMHITDWEDGVFLSEFSPEAYFENLKRARVKSPMIYLQSHVGYCYYPTKVGHIHSAFQNRPDAMRHLIDLCHAEGMDVIAYYSINYNALERSLHPEWAVAHQEGIREVKHMFSGERYGTCCPNHPEYFQFILDQVTEMLEYAPLEGIFFDMPFWNMPCYCKYCRKKYKEETGRELPLTQEGEEWKAFVYHRENWTNDYIGRLTAHTRKLAPNISIYYNYAYAVLNVLEHFASEMLNEHQDYAAGDLYNGFLTQSFACKFYSTVTKNKPFEYMTGRCDPNLACHTVTKSYDKLRLGLMLTAAHHGANLVIDAIDPKGTMDARFYEMLGKLYEEVEYYEPYLKIGEMKADVALFYSMEGRGDYQNPDYNHYQSTLNAAKTLIQNHVLYHVISQASAQNLEQYKTIILANPDGLHEETVEKLKAYVQQGGTVYISGAKQPEVLAELMDMTYIGMTDTQNTYLAPLPAYESLFENFNAAYPLTFHTRLPMVIPGSESEVMATITLPYIHPQYANAYASIHSNPPGTQTQYPAVICKKLGNGQIIWSAAGMEAERTLSYQKIFCNLLRCYSKGDCSVKTDASRSIELLVFEDKEQTLVNAVYITDEEETQLQSPFTVAVKSRPPKKVLLIRDNSEIPFQYEDGYTVFETKPLNIFDMYQILF